jgi:triosephosphate isomerase (TIM)
MRKQIVAGNWKLNTNLADALVLVESVKKLSSSVPDDVELIVAPPFTHITEVVKAAAGSKVKVSSQNCAAWEKGAYTGEVSAAMIASTGATHVIIGHSERREYFAESNAVLLDKVKLTLASGLTPIFCCGEKLDEREANNHFKVVEEQIDEVLFQLSAQDMSKVVIAYEPVWAIGTGRVASPEQAQEIHAFIRSIVEKKFGAEVAQSTSILYGGSCKPDNAQEIFAKADVDGGLIGGAALVASDFIAIAKSFGA